MHYTIAICDDDPAASRYALSLAQHWAAERGHHLSCEEYSSAEGYLFAHPNGGEPDILLLDEPTRGIDVGAKYEIYQLMIDLARQGKSIIMISSEMPELLGVCDRILVMSGGRKAGELAASGATQEAIMALAAKYV